MSIFIALGLLLGIFISLLQRHPRRLLGIIPWATLLFALMLAPLAFISAPATWFVFCTSVCGGLLPVPLASTLQGRAAKGNRRMHSLWLGVLLTTLMSVAVGVLVQLAAGIFVMPPGARWLPLVGVSIGAVVAWLLLYQSALELVLEFAIAPVYRIRGFGPGLAKFPRRGPVIVLANHSAWFDPFWLAKVIPRRIYPMMTSLFYDLPMVRWWMTNIVKAIRVQESGFRRDVPELDEAVQVLDRGDCLVIFPEGRMRRSEDRAVHPFGQGVWQILAQRPETPVVVCWIEGGWGSFCSYFNGKPTQNKRFDFWRAIHVSAGEPEVLNSEILSDRRTTRQYLLQKCLAARGYLELAPVSAPLPLDGPLDAADAVPAAKSA